MRGPAQTARTRRRALLGAALAAALAAPAAAQPTPGFVEDFVSGTAGWFGGAIITNPGAGGVGGAGDGFLNVATTATANLGVNSSGSTAFAGDYRAAGITQIRVWLNDVDTDDPLEIHLSIGNGNNFWTRDAAFLPPFRQWAQFTADLDGPAGWTRIIAIGPGTWEEALENADRIHLRHDRPPFVWAPDQIEGQFGIDRIELVGGNVGVPHPAVGAQPVELRAPYPNPSRGPVTVAMVQHRPGPVRIEIVDLAGRRVRAETLAAAGAGPRTWMWDGRDQSGRRAPAGAYRIRAAGEDGGTSQPLIRVE